MTLLPGPPALAWDALAVAARNVFATRAWAQTWWDCYGRPGKPLVLTDSAEASVVVPLYVSRGPVRQVRFLGHGPADQLGPACAPSDTGTARALLQEALSRPSPRWDLFVLHDVPVAEGWQAHLGGEVRRREASPWVRIEPGGWDAFLGRRSKNFREQLRRRERKLRTQFDVQVRLSTSETLTADMETLFRLHRLRWGADAPFASGREADLHRAFAAVALANGWLRLAVLELDGQPVAALLAYRIGDTESFYQSGRDPSFEEHSVGSVLLGCALRAAVEDGMAEYRLLRGDEAYKSRLADEDRPVHTLVRGRTVRGRAAVRLAQRRLR